MKLVQFKDGSFGIRRLGLWGYTFLDFDTMSFWLNFRRRPFFKRDCKRDKYTAQKALANYRDKGTVVKEMKTNFLFNS